MCLFDKIKQSLFLPRELPNSQTDRVGRENVVALARIYFSGFSKNITVQSLATPSDAAGKSRGV